MSRRAFSSNYYIETSIFDARAGIPRSHFTLEKIYRFYYGIYGFLKADSRSIQYQKINLRFEDLH